MFSIRAKTTLLTVCAISVTVTIAALLSVTAVRRIGTSSSEQILTLLCETGQKGLNGYFQSVEQSVEMIASFIESDVEELEPGQLEGHIDRVRAVCQKMVERTTGVLTCYYRIDPAVSAAQKGFWYISDDDGGFWEHEVTDITLYDTADTSQLVWFTVPKATGQAVWLPPYVTENLNVRVVSYNVPIYQGERFLGVIGIEIAYSTLAEQVQNIRLYENGYAFLLDAGGNMIYHPHLEASGPDRLAVPEHLMDENPYVTYTWDETEKLAVWRPLHNGMRLYVTVPMAEINENWQRLTGGIFAVFLLLLAVFALLTMQLTGFVTRPLLRLTEAARQLGEGNYDVHLDYRGNDEVGVLTRAFNQLVCDLKVYISDLNDLAYADALTSVHNKGSYDIYLRNLEARVREGSAAFAIGVFDCDNLKSINDRYGHEKGDIYLKTASSLICKVFQHSPVFRTGGDEFTVILENDDYRQRAELKHAFETESERISAGTEVKWEQVHVSMGIAVYDPQTDETAGDVVRRADKRMYENKRRRKKNAPV